MSTLSTSSPEDRPEDLLQLPGTNDADVLELGLEGLGLALGDIDGLEAQLFCFGDAELEAVHGPDLSRETYFSGKDGIFG